MFVERVVGYYTFLGFGLVSTIEGLLVNIFEPVESTIKL